MALAGCSPSSIRTFSARVNKRFAPLQSRTLFEVWTAKRLHKSDTQTERKLVMAQQNSTPTLSTLTLSDQRFAAGHESSPKNDISLLRIPQRTEEEEHGFSLTPCSDIALAELKIAGFTSRDSKFYPSTLAEVEKSILHHFKIGDLTDNFIVKDVSTPSRPLFSFHRCPF